MSNKNLGKAKEAKNDEFYTRKEDIENELYHYAEHFRGKVIYCNCDDPEYSEFWQFFKRNIKPWGIKKLIATHYEKDAQNFSYKLEAAPDADGNYQLGSAPVKTPLPCNGDFRSAACVEILKEADIVVTNPPFSLLRPFIAQLMEYGKKFLIIGNKNAITYKEIFPLLKDNKVWLGYNFPSMFTLPDGTITKQVAGLTRWFTNLDITKRHQNVDMRGNYYDPEKYPKYDNYDAIECSKVADIPIDYDGVIGVPITFLDWYNPEQFEIIGITKTWFGGASKIYGVQTQIDKSGKTSKVTKLNDGPALQVSSKPNNKTYYVVDGKCYVQTYARILIRRKGAVNHED